MPHDQPTRPKRERSTRYPGVPLADTIELCRFVDEHALDGASAAELAAALGYGNIRTNTFSSRVSAARQFGLLDLRDEGYHLTPLARAILHPAGPGSLTGLYQQALLAPTLYAELAERLAQKRVPDSAILANMLEHQFQIIGSAKRTAAEAFLESARFAAALGDDRTFRLLGSRAAAASAAAAADSEPAPARRPRAGVRLDLELWDHDAGKIIRLRAPEAITRASYERFLQAFHLLVRIEGQPGPDEHSSDNKRFGGMT